MRLKNCGQPSITRSGVWQILETLNHKGQRRHNPKVHTEKKGPSPLGMIHDLTLTGWIEGMGKQRKWHWQNQTSMLNLLRQDSLVAAGKSGKVAIFYQCKRQRWSESAAIEVWNAGKALVSEKRLITRHASRICVNPLDKSKSYLVKP